MTEGHIDYEGKGVFLALLSNGELHEVACQVVAKGVKYRYWYEDHYGHGWSEQFVESGIDDFDDLDELEIPYPDEFVYRETGKENEDENLKIISIQDIVEWEMREIDGSFDDGSGDEPMDFEDYYMEVRDKLGEK